MSAVLTAWAQVLWLTQFPKVKQNRGPRGRITYSALIVLPEVLADPTYAMCVLRRCGGVGHPKHSTESAALKCATRQMTEAWS